MKIEAAVYSSLNRDFRVIVDNDGRHIYYTLPYDVLAISDDVVDLSIDDGDESFTYQTSATLKHPPVHVSFVIEQGIPDEVKFETIAEEVIENEQKYEEIWLMLVANHLQGCNSPGVTVDFADWVLNEFKKRQQDGTFTSVIDIEDSD